MKERKQRKYSSYLFQSMGVVKMLKIRGIEGGNVTLFTQLKPFNVLLLLHFTLLRSFSCFNHFIGFFAIMLHDIF